MWICVVKKRKEFRMMPRYSTGTVVFPFWKYMEYQRRSMFKGKFLDFCLDTENLRWLWIIYEEKGNMRWETHAQNSPLDGSANLGLWTKGSIEHGHSHFF